MEEEERGQRERRECRTRAPYCVPVCMLVTTLASSVSGTISNLSLLPLPLILLLLPPSCPPSFPLLNFFSKHLPLSSPSLSPLSLFPFLSPLLLDYLLSPFLPFSQESRFKRKRQEKTHVLETAALRAYYYPLHHLSSFYQWK
jgi:hypothetical protein